MKSINCISGKVIKITWFVQLAAKYKNLDVKFQTSWVAVLQDQKKIFFLSSYKTAKM